MAKKSTRAKAKPQLDPGLLRAHKAYESAINSNNTDRVMAMYDKDAEILQPDGPTVTGRANIRKWVADYFKAYKTHWVKVAKKNFVLGDYGFDEGVDTAVDIPYAKGQPTIFWNCQGILVYKRQKNGDWLIFRDIWNNISAPTYMLPHRKK
jgi:ketosteroid isomerase-like protein